MLLQTGFTITSFFVNFNNVGMCVHVYIYTYMEVKYNYKLLATPVAHCSLTLLTCFIVHRTVGGGRWAVGGRRRKISILSYLDWGKCCLCSR